MFKRCSSRGGPAHGELFSLSRTILRDPLPVVTAWMSTVLLLFGTLALPVAHGFAAAWNPGNRRDG